MLSMVGLKSANDFQPVFFTADSEIFDPPFGFRE